MSENNRTPVVEYAHLAGQRSPSTRHSPAVICSLLCYIGAIGLWSGVEFYGWIKYEPVYRQFRLYPRVILRYQIDDVFLWLTFFGMIAAFAALLTPRRKIWAAIIALFLNFTAYRLNFEFGYPILPSLNR